jgi:hypothetical protein
MAKEYGVPITPDSTTEGLIVEIAEHLNWSKTDVVAYCVGSKYETLKAFPRAIRPTDVHS